MTFQVEVRCEAGHTQTFRVVDMSREWVESWAGLMDGTSPMYVYPPTDFSPIGKCGICSRRLKTTVTEVEG